MPAHSYTTHEKDHHRSVLANIAETVGTLTPVGYADLRAICTAMKVLRQKTFVGRTYASFASEYRYRTRTYFAREQRLRLDDRTIGFDGLQFGFGDNDPEFDEVINLYGLRFVLTSLDYRYALVYDMPILNKLLQSTARQMTVAVMTPKEIHVPPVPVLVHHRGQLSDIPHYGVSRFDATPDMTVREFPRLAGYVNRLYTGTGRHGVWLALERIWCEILQRQRPFVRPLTRESVEARVRSLAGLKVRIEHTKGVCIGRCPGIERFLGSKTLTITTANRDEKIPTDAIFEMGPWNGAYGRGLLLDYH